VVVRDAFNNVVSGVSVTFTVSGGGGTTSPVGGVVATDGSGVAALTSWTLGATSGINNNTLSAAAGGLTGSPLTFTASSGSKFLVTVSPAGPYAAAQVVTISAQLATAGDIAVAAAGVTVNWTIATGSGTLGVASSVTNASGIATVSLTLGATGTDPSVTATAGTATGTSAVITVP
jgi:hypothetical protein